ncbi:ComF family protein [Alkalilimnicola ehrlichii]|uniref:ComF family protein n=1 Tax=Alkalilimnicola ehrlichii TaxID=351052 RepID=UPI003BA2652E
MDGIHHWLRAIGHGLDRLYPPRCVLCGEPGQPPALDLCAGCQADLPWVVNPCARCGQPLPEDSAAGGLCADCLCWPPRFDKAVVPLDYRFPVDRLVTGFKFHGGLATGRVLGTLLAQAAGARGEALPEVLVPVPLHRSRLLERGYNQAMELARHITRILPGRRVWHGVRRVRATSAQSGLNRARRSGNVRGAFVLEGAPPAQHVALVDDVMTTGATLDGIAGCLKAAGVEVVEAWAVARTPPPAHQPGGSPAAGGGPVGPDG